MRCLILWIQNLTFSCFACAGVTEKHRCLNMGDEIPSSVTRMSRNSRIEFLGLTKTGLFDIDGERLASALAATSGLGKEGLDEAWISLELTLVRMSGTDSMRWELQPAWSYS